MTDPNDHPTDPSDLAPATNPQGFEPPILRDELATFFETLDRRIAASERTILAAFHETLDRVLAEHEKTRAEVRAVKKNAESFERRLKALERKAA